MTDADRALLDLSTRAAMLATLAIEKETGELGRKLKARVCVQVQLACLVTAIGNDGPDFERIRGVFSNEYTKTVSAEELAELWDQAERQVNDRGRAGRGGGGRAGAR